jgi:hypothetical protein
MAPVSVIERYNIGKTIRGMSMKMLFALFFLASYVPCQVDVPYQVLRIQRSDAKTDPWERVGCAVSIANSVDVETLKKVICAVIRRENLNQYEAIVISVYYGIKQLRDPPIDPLTPKDGKYLIGAYSWSLDVNPTGKLFVALDEKGRSIQGGRLALEFSHMRDCR